MESSTSDGHDFYIDLRSNAEVGDSPTTTPPTLHLHFDFRSSLFYFQSDLRVLQDPISWRQEVERMLLTVLLDGSGGGGGPFDVSRLATEYCEYFDVVIGRIPVHYGRSIRIRAQIAAALPSSPLAVPARPEFDAELVDYVTMLSEGDWESVGGGSGDTPASTAAFLESVLKVVTFGEGGAEEVYADGSCSICLDDFKAGRQLYVMPCHHRFHMECLEEWLDRRHVCPLCRFDLSDPAVPVEE